MAKARATRAEFLRRYGGIYEHSPWVAEQAYEEAAAITDPDRLAEIFARHVNAADEKRKLALIRSHPDLAGKAAVGAHAEGNRSELEPSVAADGDRGRPATDAELTPASRQEQQSAGIDQCTPEEYKQFHKLNRRYKDKFGFPFIMAVRGSNREEILRAFAARLDNDSETELATAITEVHKIARLRLQANAQ